MHTQSLSQYPWDKLFYQETFWKKPEGFCKLIFFSDTKNDLFCKKYLLNNNEEC